MPSIEVDGHSEAEFVLRDGKIVRIEQQSHAPGPEAHRPESPEDRGSQYSGP